MLLMASGGLGLPEVAATMPGSAVWRWIGHECDHAAWAPVVQQALVLGSFWAILFWMYRRRIFIRI
jgi:hypothetical protein